MPDPQPDPAAVLAGARTADEHARGERRNADLKVYASVGLVAGGLVLAVRSHPDLPAVADVVWDLGVGVGVVSVLLLWWAGMPGIVWHAQPRAGNVFELRAAARAGRLPEVLAASTERRADDATRQVEAMSRLAVARYLTVWVGQALAVVAGALLGVAWLAGVLS